MDSLWTCLLLSVDGVPDGCGRLALCADQRNDRDADEFEQYGQFQQYGQYGRGRAATGAGGALGGPGGPGGPTQAWQTDQPDHYPITPPEGQFPMQNGGHIKFEVPKVPVIFVLGEYRIHCVRAAKRTYLTRIPIRREKRRISHRSASQI